MKFSYNLPDNPIKSEDAERRLNAAIAFCQKNFSPTVRRGISAMPETFSAGLPEIDSILGGGYHSGGITLIKGEEASGKTYLLLCAVAAAQKRGELCLWFDMDHTFNAQRAAALGVNVDDLYICQPSTIQEAIGIGVTLAKYQIFDLIIYDSLTSLPFSSRFSDMFLIEIAGTSDLTYENFDFVFCDNLFSKAFPAFLRSRQSVLASLIHRDFLSVMSPDFRPEGGRAMLFYASAIIELCRLDFYSLSKSPSGRNFMARCEKNKYSAPYKQTEFKISFR